MGNSILKYYNSLSKQEKIKYLNKMSESVKKNGQLLDKISLLMYDITCLYDNTNDEIKQCFLVILMSKLGYKEINNELHYQKNLQIINALIPSLNLKKVVYIYTNDKTMQIKFLEDIKNDLNNLVRGKNYKIKEITWKKF